MVAPRAAGPPALSYTPTAVDNVRLAWLAGKRSANTRAGYAKDITEWLEWLEAHRELPHPFEVHRVHVDAYVHYLRSGDHAGRYAGKHSYAESTILRKLSTISSFYDYVVAESPYMVANPCSNVARPKVADESMTAGLDVDEARAILEAADGRGLRDAAAVRLLLTTGIRVSELCKADTGDLSDERGMRVITVTRKGGKRQKLPVPPSAAQALTAYLGPRRGPLFLAADGTRIKRQHVWWVLQKCSETVFGTAPGAKRIHPHSLRHTAATLALEAGEPIHQVQDMLGHADPKTTMRYNRARNNLERSAVHTLERVLGGGDQ